MKPTLTAAQPNPFEAPDYLARARTFRQAALQLTDMLGHQPNWPKYFLLGHAIELALKAVPKYCQRSRSYQKPSGDEPANHEITSFAFLPSSQATSYDPIRFALARDLAST
jgi:hypothetical protein